MKKTEEKVGVLAKMGKIANKALTDIGVLSNGPEEFSKEGVTELMAEYELKDGQKVYFDDKEKAPGSGVYLMGEDGDKMPLPAGEYELKDGTIFMVSDDGKVGEAPAAEMEDEMEDAIDMEEKPMDMEQPAEEIPAEMMEAPTELEQAVEPMVMKAIEAAIAKKLESMGLLPQEEMAGGYNTAMPAEEMSKEESPKEAIEDPEVEEFNHSPSKVSAKSTNAEWQPSKTFGTRRSITEQLRNS